MAVNKIRHELKILPRYFQYVWCGDKKFEIRLNDRDFRKGDIVHLKEWNGKEYTGRDCLRKISYILYDDVPGIEKGFCVFGLARVEE